MKSMLTSDIYPYIHRASSNRHLRRIMISEARIFLSDTEISNAYEAVRRNLKYFPIGETDTDIKRGIFIPTRGSGRIGNAINVMIINALTALDGHDGSDFDPTTYDFLICRDTLYMCGNIPDEALDLAELMADWLVDATDRQILYFAEVCKPNEVVDIFKILDERWTKLIKLDNVKWLTARIINEYRGRRVFDDIPLKEPKPEPKVYATENVEDTNIDKYFDYTMIEQVPEESKPKKLSFIESIKLFIKNIFNFVCIFLI